MARSAVLAAAVITAAVSAVSVCAPAGADANEAATLEVHAAGSVYAGPGSLVSAEAAPGAATTFSVLLLNSGQSAEQYLVHVYPLIDPTSIATYAVKAGSAVVTAQATDPDGYYTPPIAAGKTLALTVTVTPPKTATIFDDYFTNITASDVAGDVLSSVQTQTYISSTTGTGADLFVTGSGQKSVIGTGQYANVSDPAIKPGASSTYAVKLLNSQPTPTAFTVSMTDGANCGSYFTPTVKAGSSDITAAVLAGAYQSAVLAKGKSLAITVTVKYTSKPPVESCDYPFDVETLTATPSVNGPETVNLVTVPAYGTAQTLTNIFFDPLMATLTPIATDDNLYQPSCAAGRPCPSSFLIDDHGTATAFDADGVSASESYLSESFVATDTLSGCREAGGAEPFYAYSSTDDNVSQITYTSYGAAADAAYAAGGGNGTDHICYAASQPFTGYFPMSGRWNGTYAHDASDYGVVPQDPHTGQYVGLLPTCAQTAGVKPCLAGAGSYTLTGARHEYQVVVDAAAGDSPEIAS